MTFQLYDEHLGKAVPFEPVNPPQVSIYSCGLTVQAPPHLGHMRKEAVFDVLKRWLEAIGYQVKLVINVTDINAKIEAKAAERGIEWYQVAYEVELDLHEARRALGLTPPDYEPRASGHITEQVDLIARLIERGHAYAAPDGSGDVYFDVRSWPEYGELSNQAIDAMQDDEEAETRGKRDPHDFALWKGVKPTDPVSAVWPSPWGPGRPAWHLECSAMAHKYLGEAFDIHGGGLDLRFPHHENEQAQSRAAGYSFARYWMHNAFVTMSGEKMSKSLGNTASVNELVKLYPARALRLYLIAPHYRSTVELSDVALAESVTQLERIDGFLMRAGATSVAPFEFEALPAAFVAAMNNDLGTPAALAVIFDTVKAGNKALDTKDATGVEQALREVRAMLHVFGLDPYAAEWTEQPSAGLDRGAVIAGIREYLPGGLQNSVAGEDLSRILSGLLDLAVERRAAARAMKDWGTADAIRDRLIELGLRIEDSSTGEKGSKA